MFVSTWAAEPPLHCGLLAVDICGFSRRRDPDIQTHLRQAVHRLIQDACASSDIDWAQCHHEDRGDGLFVITPPHTSVQLLLDPLAMRVRAALQRHNKIAGDQAQLRLRLAIHAGYVHRDARGATSNDLTHLFRLLDAPEFKTIAARSSDMTLITSNEVHRQVIRPGLCLDPAHFRALSITTSHGHTARAWTWASDHSPGRIASPTCRLHIALLLSAGWSPHDLDQTLRTSPPARQLCCPALADLLTDVPTPPSGSLNPHHPGHLGDVDPL